MKSLHTTDVPNGPQEPMISCGALHCDGSERSSLVEQNQAAPVALPWP